MATLMNKTLYRLLIYEYIFVNKTLIRLSEQK
uniref:Uncharacterized protein n=1 Tax=Anguilla anguilla TaxID=7936 RepID=A0A0E9U1N9_ANGAN